MYVIINCSIETCSICANKEIYIYIMRLPNHPFDSSQLEEGPHLCQGHI